MKIMPLVLPVIALVVGSFIIYNKSVERPSVTTVDIPPTLIIAEVPDAGQDAGPNHRPTAEQLADTFLTWELRDLVDQAATPEDKQLVQEALDIRKARAKALEISKDFETNMQRAIK